MLINTILLTLGLGSSILAGPVLEKKQTTSPVPVIVSAINTLQVALTNDQYTILTAGDAVKNDVSAQLQVVAALNVGLADIATALQTAENSIVAVTVNAAGDITAAASGLLQADVKQLEDSINQVVSLIQGIQATLRITATNLGPAAQAAIAAEVTAVTNTINPFVAPLVNFAQAVQHANVGGTLIITGLTTAVSGLISIVASLVGDTLGVTHRV